MKKRLTAVFLVLLLVLTVTPLTIADNTNSYTDASGVVYQLSSDGTYAFVSEGTAANGTVTIRSSVTIGSGTYAVKEIAASAFYGSAVSSVSLASSVEKIGDLAFAYCPSLTEFDFSNAQVSLGNRIFDGSCALTQLKNTAEIKKVGYGVFDSTGWFSDAASSVTDSAVYIGKVLLTFVGDASAFSIDPNAQSIAPNAFADNNTLKSIDLSGITSIGANAFNGCTGLANVIFGNNISEIGSYAFEGCSALSGTITLPASVKKLEAGAFEESGISVANLSATKLTSIENGAFAGCDNLTKVILPESVTIIENYVFQNTPLLSDINAQKVTSIGYDAFRGCTNLSDKEAFENVEYIGSGAFDGTSIYSSADGQAVTIGKAFYKTEETVVSSAIQEGIKQISPYAFYAATAFDTLALPVSLEKINNDAFLSIEDGTIYVFSTADSVYQDLSDLSAGTVYIPTGKSIDNPNISVGNITGISLSSNPTKTAYTANEIFDPSGMKIVLNTTLGEASENVDIADIGYAPTYSYDFSASPTVTISYCGYTTTLNVTLKNFLPGDLNNSGVVDTDDLLLLRKYIAGLVASDSINAAAADVDKSGIVDTDDLLTLRKAIAGLITLN